MKGAIDISEFYRVRDSYILKYFLSNLSANEALSRF